MQPTLIVEKAPDWMEFMPWSRMINGNTSPKYTPEHVYRHLQFSYVLILFRCKVLRKVRTSSVECIRYCCLSVWKTESELWSLLYWHWDSMSLVSFLHLSEWGWCRPFLSDGYQSIICMGIAAELLFPSPSSETSKQNASLVLKLCICGEELLVCNQVMIQHHTWTGWD